MITCIQKVKSVLGINKFPSSPLFCQEPAGHFGLVGIGMEQETDGNEGKYYGACVRNLELRVPNIMSWNSAGTRTQAPLATQVLNRDWSPKFPTLLMAVLQPFLAIFFAKTDVQTVILRC